METTSIHGKKSWNLFSILISVNSASDLKKKLGGLDVVNVTMLKKDWEIQTREDKKELADLINEFILNGWVKEIGYADVHELQFLK